MSHTPGPWSYEAPEWASLPYLVGANGDVVATFHPGPENSSDIPLLAAAPELLEALEKLFYLVVSDGIGKDEGVRRLQMAADVLAKVRGTQCQESIQTLGDK